MGWWPFSRRQKAAPGVETPPASNGDSPETWSVGDLAECLSTGLWFWSLQDSFGGRHHLREEGPQRTEIYLVTGVCIIDGKQGLQFTRFPRNCFYHSIHFCKITPRADTAEAADAGFIDLLAKVQS